ncbi:S41 family peptidase [Aurantiacibacter sp. MUD61]|uniref:S41 family peptidase n=1 Tax=Aurantiacibacter sp. MUD61 TaxID=3009083 RepID=UPI0022F057E2|nr:S41 family peptidase [Aurantiacibacter sp. MUD61]
MLVSCGGGSDSPPPLAGGGGGGAGGGGGGGTAGCSITERLDFIDQVFSQWYLFPSLLDNSVNRAGVTNTQSYINDRVAPARAQNIDRFFSYITSIEEEEAFANSGATAGFGFRIGYDDDNRRVFVVETFEGTAALGANIDRGSEILAIGTPAANLVTVNSLLATGGRAAVSDALGPGDPGTTRVLRVIDQAGVQRDVSLTKTNFTFDPISDRYGSLILNDGGKQVGYFNLRTFSVDNDEAIADLRSVYSGFRAQGVRELIIDLRYNGGGRINYAAIMADLMGRNRGGQVFSTIEFNDARASENNSTLRFDPDGNSIAPLKIAFITTRGTASASELIINGMDPYVEVALIGSDTFGKPVGQSAFDLSECDARFRPVTLQIANSNGRGDYYNGLADVISDTCRANDDISRQFGDPNEAMIATALDYLAGRSCTAIAGGGIGIQSVGDSGLLAPEPQERSYAQHEVPGLY